MQFLPSYMWEIDEIQAMYKNWKGFERDLLFVDLFYFAGWGYCGVN